jgi:hypothetical protein
MSSILETTPSISSPSDNYFDSFTTSEAYNEKLEILDETESVTTQYNKTLKNQISQALLLTFELTTPQFDTLIDFVFAIVKIEQECDCKFNGIGVTPSVENEIVFHRKSQQGISTISIDLDGDILLNFTGFKKGFETERYQFGVVNDFEILVYHFLAR